MSAASHDEAIVDIARRSVAVRWLSRPGAAAMAAWPRSRAAAALARWRTLPLERRVRAIAAALMTAIATHAALTGFGAPVPLPAARAVWIGLFVLCGAAAAAAGPIAAAWRDRIA